jgi:electron transport complex protein RnfG
VSEHTLPVLGPEGGSPAAPKEVEVSSLRLVGTLTVAGALAGLAIVLVFQWAQPRIEAYQALVLEQAITEVLGGPERYETFFIEDGGLTLAPAGDTAALDRVWVGYGPGDQPVGVAVVGAKPGFQDVIRLIFGYDPGSGDVLGMKVLESKETPGLGDKIEKDSTFVAEFVGVDAPLDGVKPNEATGADDEVVMITGATISSRVIIEIINERLEGLDAPLRSFWGSPAATARAGSTGQARAPTAPDRGGGGTAGSSQSADGDGDRPHRAAAGVGAPPPAAAGGAP